MREEDESNIRGGETDMDLYTPVDSHGYLVRLDKAAFYDELLEGFICREYVDRFGPLEWDFKAKAIERYRNDPIFHNRVQQVTGHIMMLLGKHKR